MVTTTKKATAAQKHNTKTKPIKIQDQKPQYTSKRSVRVKKNSQTKQYVTTTAKIPLS